jgi:hypothetical protein
MAENWQGSQFDPNRKSMPDPRSDPPLHPENRRSLFIAAGISGVLMVIAYFVGGSFIPLLCGFISIVLILRGAKPTWFAHHIDAQIIQQTPYQRSESFPKWCLAALLCLVFAFAANLLYGRFAPARPNIVSSLLNGVKTIVHNELLAFLNVRTLPSLIRQPPPPSLTRSKQPHKSDSEEIDPRLGLLAESEKLFMSLQNWSEQGIIHRNKQEQEARRQSEQRSLADAGTN